MATNSILKGVTPLETVTGVAATKTNFQKIGKLLGLAIHDDSEERPFLTIPKDSWITGDDVIVKSSREQTMRVGDILVVTAYPNKIYDMDTDKEYNVCSVAVHDEVSFARLFKWA